MDPSFQQWLKGRDIPPKLLKTLQKEDVTTKMTLQAMNDADIDVLKKKHKLGMGHVVLLRSVRDELTNTEGAPASRSEYSFEVLHAPPEPGRVERDAGQERSAPSPPYPGHYEGASRKRLRGDEIRDKYKLPARNDKYSKRSDPPRNGVPSDTPPLPDHDTPHTPTPGAGSGLRAASQMYENYRRGVERGEKLSALEQKSRGLVSGAMEYERMCSQVAEDRKLNKKKRKNKQRKDESSTPTTQPSTHSPDETKKKTSTYPPSPPFTNTKTTNPPSQPPTQQPTQNPTKTKKTSTYPQSEQYQRLSASAHSTHRHSSQQSPSHTHSSTPHSDPIRQRLPHVVPNYGTMTEERSRPTTPTSLYTAEDDSVQLHYNPEAVKGKQTANGSATGCCSCCRTM